MKILRIQEEHRLQVERETEEALHLGFKERTRRLDELFDREYRRAVFIWEKYKELGKDEEREAELRLKEIEKVTEKYRLLVESINKLH